MTAHNTETAGDAARDVAFAPIARILSAPRDRPFVVAQLGQSLDGRIAIESGESRWINGQSALVHVHRVRAAVDAVVVGVGTVAADDPLLNVRHVAGRNPARVVIDPHGRLPQGARCLLGEDGCRRVVVRATEGPLPKGVEELRVQWDNGRLDPTCIIGGLFRLGLKSMLIEGGAHTVSAFLAARALDRLHVLVAPVILGSGKPGLQLPPIARLADALRPPADVHVLNDGDVLFDCDLRACKEGSIAHGNAT
jgi:diaminohydroxyphosphoribosylaminopyrimidine deaminase / 5-amino-6-(5-phosphoribosylamino)uracil reductase